MKLFTIVVFAMASLFNLGILDARYKIDIKVEGGPKGCIPFHFHTLVDYIISIIYHIYVFDVSYCMFYISMFQKEALKGLD